MQVIPNFRCSLFLCRYSEDHRVTMTKQTTKNVTFKVKLTMKEMMKWLSWYSTAQDISHLNLCMERLLQQHYNPTGVNKGEMLMYVTQYFIQEQLSFSTKNYHRTEIDIALRKLHEVEVPHGTVPH